MFQLKTHSFVSEPNPVLPKLTDCKMHIKVIVSQTAAVDVEGKLHTTAVTRNRAAKTEVSEL